MGKFIDFIVPYDPDPEVLGKTILQHITCHRIDANKPCIIFISGDSGEGKSCIGLKILDAVNDYYGVDTLETLHDSIIYIPIEYLDKLENCLYWKRRNRPDLKNMHCLIMDEAREVINAKDWSTYLNRAIANINVMTRRIKPMVYIIISQFIKDIDSSIRYTLNYYLECKRPLQGRTIVSFNKIWKNTYDLEKPKLCKRPLVGYIRHGHSQSKFYPNFTSIMPNQEIFKKYDDQNFKAKSKILSKRIEQTINKIKKQIGDIFDKVEVLVAYYSEDTNRLRMIQDPKYKKFHVRKDLKDMHDLTRTEYIEFEKRLYEKLVEMNIIGTESGE